jgi:pyruvate-ferredoxin/flavodoxin oxidoreductase
MADPSRNGSNGSVTKPFPYPGIPDTAEGGKAVAYVEAHITQGGCAYPITSSTIMGEGYQEFVANGHKNLWGEELCFVEPESEHSSASACEGFAVAGGRVTNFTSGQGLVLMKEVLYTISGKRLPAVFHIGARALTSQSLNVHAGHDDVMSVRDCGWGMLFAKNAQDAGDLALIARRAAEDSETPFFNVQDGFLTTHTVENLLKAEPEMMKEYVGHASAKIRNFMDPTNPVMSGVVQNQDAYMKGKIAQRAFYDKVPEIVRNAMEEFYRLTGRRYDLVERYQMDDAEYALVGMGGMMETAMATVDWIRENVGIKVGVVHVICYRPFPARDIIEALGKVKAMCVLERMDDPLAPDNPLTQDIKGTFIDALTQTKSNLPKVAGIPKIYSCSAGLGSRDVRAGDFLAITKAMAVGLLRDYFVVGIKHPLALPMGDDPDVRPQGAFSMRGHSVGGYGSVTTNKIIADFAGEVFKKQVQAYPKYGSEKKGLPTTYYLTIADDHIRPHCELEHVEFVPVNDINAFKNADPLSGLQAGGMIFVQTPETDPAKVWAEIPAKGQKAILKKKVRVLYLDTAKIAREECSTPDLIVRMQGIVLVGIFLRCTPFADQVGLTGEQVLAKAEAIVRRRFGKRGEQVVKENLNCIRRGYMEIQEVPHEVMAGAALVPA